MKDGCPHRDRSLAPPPRRALPVEGWKSEARRLALLDELFRPG
jgi:hypothetical protein